MEQRKFTPAPIINLWICSSCAGYYYDYCHPILAYDEYETPVLKCFVGNRIVKCPYGKYHFIPTKRYSSQNEVAKDFPEQFGE